jgi:2Fe-2S type ferredoxin
MATYKVKLTGSGVDTTINCPDDQYVLDAAEEQGVDLPYSCRAGACSTCAGKVVSGTVEMKINYALDENEVANGLVLSCQAVPTSEKVVVDFGV